MTYQNDAEKLLLNSSITGNVDDFKKALELGANPNCKNQDGDTPLSLVSKCRLDLVKLLIRHGADPNLKTDSNITPLHWAVEYDNSDIVTCLLENGARTDLEDNLSETALHWAAWTGHYKVADIIIKFGGNLNCKNVGNFSPIDLAKKQGHTETIRLFEKYCNI